MILGPKLALYQRAAVPEYLAILIEEKRFEWRLMVQDRYQLLEASNGVFPSRVLPGLRIDEVAFWSEAAQGRRAPQTGKKLLCDRHARLRCAASFSIDNARLLAVLDEALNSPEFRSFKLSRTNR